MTNPTPQDREMAAIASGFSSWEDACYWSNLAKQTAVADLAEAFMQARLQGRREGLEEAARALEADAQLCDCHAHDEGECACGAWCQWKTVPMHRAVEIVRTLYGAEPDKDGEG